MTRVAVWSGVRICSHSAETTRPKAKPVTPETSAPAKVARRKIPMSRSDPSMCARCNKKRAALAWDRQLDGEAATPPPQVYHGRSLQPNEHSTRPREFNQRQPANEAASFPTDHP